MNLRQRYEINLRCGTFLKPGDPVPAEVVKMREAARVLIARDPAFFVNAFCWTYDPVRYMGKNQYLPLLLFPIQEMAVKEIAISIRRGTSLGFVKSREAGVTWIVLAVIVAFWLSQHEFNFRLSSHGEKHVYKADDKDTLFWKAQFIVDKLPQWLQPAGWNPTRDINFMMMRNPENQSTLTGSAPTASFVVSGRTSGLLFDEFPLWQDAEEVWGASAETSPCRLIIGTPRGAGNQYAKLMNPADGVAVIKRVDMDWRDDPRKNHYVVFSRKPALEEIIIRPDLTVESPYSKFSAEEMLRPSFLESTRRLGEGQGWCRGTLGQNCPVDNVPARVKLDRMEGFVYYPWYDYKKWREFAGDMAKVAQELDRSFSRSVSNLVCHQFQYAKRGKFEYDRNLAASTYTTWDVGLDGVAIIWIQADPIKQHVTLIDYKFAQDKTIDWFAPFITGEIPYGPDAEYDDADIEMIERHAAWKYAAHSLRLPPEEVDEHGYRFNSIDPTFSQESVVARMSVEKALRPFRIYFRANELARSTKYRYEAGNRLLSQTRIDEVRCAELIQAFENFQYPARASQSQSTVETTKGVHNKYSHGPNAYFYFATVYQPEYVDPSDFARDQGGVVRDMREIMSVNNGRSNGPSGMTGYGF